MRIFLGQGFCDNPLYADRIEALDVRRCNGHLMGDTGLEPLMELIDDVQLARNQDLASLKAFGASFEHIYATCPAAPNARLIQELVTHCWPKTLAATTTAAFVGFALSPFDQVIALGGTPADATAFVALCVQFGPALAQDPLYPWAGLCCTNRLRGFMS